MQETNKDFSVRGIARSLKLSHATVISHIEELHDLDLIRKKNDTLYPTYYANNEGENMRSYKRDSIKFSIIQSGLVEYIKDKTLPSSIILFGSCAKGTYTKKSDIDIFVEAKESKLDISKFEKKLKRSINLLFESKISNLSDELKNNILNGIILHGFIKL